MQTLKYGCRAEMVLLAARHAYTRRTLKIVVRAVAGWTINKNIAHQDQTTICLSTNWITYVDNAERGGLWLRCMECKQDAADPVLCRCKGPYCWCGNEDGGLLERHGQNVHV